MKRLVLIFVLVSLSPCLVWSATFVFPNIEEKQGSISTTSFTTDTLVFMVYTPGLGGSLGGSSANVDLYFYDAAGGAVLSATSVAVCNPCSFVLNVTTRKQTANFESLITAAGGFPAATISGYVVAVVQGADPLGVALQAAVVRSRRTPLDLEWNNALPISLGGAPASDPRVLPHFVTFNPASASNERSKFNAAVVASYAGGQAGLPAGGGAMLDVYLYNGAGQPLRSATNTIVANPATVVLSNTQSRIDFSDLIVSAGGFTSTVMTGFAVVVVSGADPAMASAVFDTRVAPAVRLTPGDANGDQAVTVADIFYLINSLFAGGPPPVN